jgi:WXG100 family type VII secretion target
VSNTNISWGQGGMNSSLGSFQNALEESTSSYSSMMSQIESLGPAWTGEAATVYSGAMEEWLTQFNKVIQALGGILEKMGSNLNINTNTHTDTTDAARTLGSSMADSVPALPGF